MVALATMLSITGSAHGACWETSNQATRQASAPTVMEITLKGEIRSYMERELIKDIEDSLTKFPSLKTVKIKLSSFGGSTFTGYILHNYLRGLHERNGLQVVMHNIMAVESSAVFVYCGGNQRVMSPYSYFMVHETSRRLDDRYTRAELMDAIEHTDVTKEAKNDLLSSCTNLTVKQADDLSNGETYFDADKALDLGLAHSILPATFDRMAGVRCLIDSADEKKEEPKK